VVTAEAIKAEALQSAKTHAADLRTIEMMLGAAVRDAVRHGATWAEVGEAIGMARQNAHRKYARRARR
jgi:hypothetical protein